MSIELLNYFDFDVSTSTLSAYIQQQTKVLSEAFEFLFHEFATENNKRDNLCAGYQFLTCDDSNLSIATNVNNSETAWKSNQSKKFQTTFT